MLLLRLLAFLKNGLSEKQIGNLLAIIKSKNKIGFSFMLNSYFSNPIIFLNTINIVVLATVTSIVYRMN